MTAEPALRNAGRPAPVLSELRIEPVRLAPPNDPALPRNAFTVDVEDWYQSCLDYDAPITERVVRNVDRVLEVLDACAVKGTFFVQGRVAETYPALVRSLVDEGHEVQSHGYSHRPLFGMSRDELREELERAKATVEDAAGTPVTAFRAQDFSVLARNLWALETMVEVGFEVDSSIFPMRSRHYGVPGWPLEPHDVVLGDESRLLEVPVAIWSCWKLRFPVAGGGYFRLLPQRVIGAGIGAVNAAGRPAVVYCHPYEFNDDELGDYPDAPRLFRSSQGLGRGRFAARIRSLLARHSFGRFSDVLAAWGIR
ncbi:MAG TPA: polysaccharide deacetylase family protein [Gaiellaceae bacterium]|nr:polysaccharide deacetylase family protein [Gaiellaceae bacterium]